jgi:hypothetical protein
MAMPAKATVQQARKDARQGKSPGTQAGAFVREEMEHIRRGKHGARNRKQAIAIGLSKARRTGVKLAPPEKGKASAAARRKAEREPAKSRQGEGARRPPKRSRTRRRTTQSEERQALHRPARLAARARRPRATTPRRKAA